MNRHDLLLRIRGFFLRRRVEEELDEELRFHLEMATRKNAAKGASAAEAARLARVRFGALDPVKEECRNVRGTQLIESTIRDIGYALRGFRRSPLFVVTVIGTIALGLGLNTAVFTLFNYIVLRPFPVRDPYSLYAFTWADRLHREQAFSWHEFENFRKEQSGLLRSCRIPLFLCPRGRPSTDGRLSYRKLFSDVGRRRHPGRTLLPEGYVGAWPGTSDGAQLRRVAEQVRWRSEHPRKKAGVARVSAGGGGRNTAGIWRIGCRANRVLGAHHNDPAARERTQYFRFGELCSALDRWQA